MIPRGHVCSLCKRRRRKNLAAEEKAKADQIKAGRSWSRWSWKGNSTQFPQTGQPEPLNTNAWPRYVVFLRGQSTCPITRNFAPTFIKYCNGIKSTHPEVEVVYFDD